MDARQQRGLVIAATCKIVKKKKDIYLVPSQTRPGALYYVHPKTPRCDCKDFDARGETCKHLFAVQYFIDRERNVDGSTTVTETLTVTKKKTYPQDWPKYNQAQTTEKRWFCKLLADLCGGIQEPERKNQRGNPIPLRDALYAAIFKVYSGFSARRFTCDLEAAMEDGHISRAPHFNSVLNVLEAETTTPILHALLAKSASPLRDVEKEWAVDSTGFSGSRYITWVDEKWGNPKRKVAWQKIHAICGTRTGIIPHAIVTEEKSNDSPQLPPLVNATAKTFTVKQVTADKAYASRANFNAVDEVGGTLYAAFKGSATGAVGGLYGKMYHFFLMHKEEYEAKYHRRSLIESAFSSIKRVLGNGLRSKSDLAMRNESMSKLVAHNIRCVVAAIYELGITPSFLPGDSIPLNGGCTTDTPVAQ